MGGAPERLKADPDFCFLKATEEIWREEETKAHSRDGRQFQFMRLMQVIEGRNLALDRKRSSTHPEPAAFPCF
jgi:hypothetical protein